jgi:hypothetical protein
VAFAEGIRSQSYWRLSILISQHLYVRSNKLLSKTYLVKSGEILGFTVDRRNLNNMNKIEMPMIEADKLKATGTEYLGLK